VVVEESMRPSFGCQITDVIVCYVEITVQQQFYSCIFSVFLSQLECAVSVVGTGNTGWIVSLRRM